MFISTFGSNKCDFLAPGLAPTSGKRHPLVVTTKLDAIRGLRATHTRTH